MKLETQQDCWKALVAGKSLRHKETGEVVSFTKGKVHNTAGVYRGFTFTHAYQWEVVEGHLLMSILMPVHYPDFLEVKFPGPYLKSVEGKMVKVTVEEI